MARAWPGPEVSGASDQQQVSNAALESAACCFRVDVREGRDAPAGAKENSAASARVSQMAGQSELRATDRPSDRGRSAVIEGRSLKEEGCCRISLRSRGHGASRPCSAGRTRGSSRWEGLALWLAQTQAELRARGGRAMTSRPCSGKVPRARDGAGSRPASCIDLDVSRRRLESCGRSHGGVTSSPA